MKKLSFLIGLFTILCGTISTVSAHPGRTAADGCHYCRTNCDKWGEEWNVRHCHGGGSDSSSSPTQTTTTTTSNTYTKPVVQQAPAKPVLDCPANSSQKTDDSCECDTGYKSTASGTACEIDQQYKCDTQYSGTTYIGVQGNCACQPGFELQGKKCIATPPAQPTAQTTTKALSTSTPVEATTTSSSNDDGDTAGGAVMAILVGGGLVYAAKRNARKKK